MSLPLPRPRRPARLVAPVPLTVAVTALAGEVACVGAALGTEPDGPAWVPIALFLGCIGCAALTIGTLRRAVSGRPRASRHHGVLVTYAGAHRAVRTGPITTERSAP